ncbi:MAG TPA: hypothetical protein VGD31_16175 [Sphingobacteriaceae bacterium]
MYDDPRPIIIRVAVSREWRRVGERTVLYYAYHLTSQYSNVMDATIREELEDMVSLQDYKGQFDGIVNRFVRAGIMTSTDKCGLTPIALEEVERLMVSDLGDFETNPFYNLRIVATSTSQEERFALWVERGCTELINLFKDVPNIKPSIKDIGRKRGRLLFFSIENDIRFPVLIFWFINTPRMKRATESEPLLAAAQELSNERQRQLLQYSNQSISGARVIDVIAAPTYANAVAVDAFAGQFPKRTIGPINLAAIIEHFRKYPELNEKHYQAILEWIDPVFGPHTGIIFSDDLIEYLRQRV